MNRLNWGLIGGGAGSQIGPAHRLGAGLDGLFSLSAGAFDIDPGKSREFGATLGAVPMATGRRCWRRKAPGRRKMADLIW